MSTVNQQTSADELPAMPNGSDFELVDGELVELKTSAESSWVAGQIFRRLGNVAEDAGLGWAFPEGTGFRCFQDDPERVRRADASFVRGDRLPHGPPARGFCPVAPDLVVEVVSPNDIAYQVDAKVEDWIEAGVTEVWLVMPPGRSVTVYRSGAQPRRLGEQDRISIGDVIPGLECPIAEFFLPPTAPRDAAT